MPGSTNVITRLIAIRPPTCPNGIRRHLLTTADKYAVEIYDPVPQPLRTMVVVTAIVMDMNLHESKEIT